MKGFLSQKKETNYLYFSIFLLFLFTLSSLHDIDLHPLYFLYVALQALLEVACFILIALALKKILPKWVYHLFISGSFLVLLGHFLNYLLIHLLDSTFTNLINLLFFSGLNHFIAGFLTLNLSAKTWILFSIALIAIPLSGLGLYHFTSWICKKWPLHLSPLQLITTIITLGIGLTLMDLVVSPHISEKNYIRYKKRVPLGTAIIPPQPQLISLKEPIQIIQNEDEIRNGIPQISASHLPNIYLFVIETFRKDFLCHAPHLTQFAKEHIDIEESFSNANGTHLSWFSIFHAKLPFSWSQKEKTWKKGSIPIQMLKNLGYKIHLYSAADLQIFNMDKLLFGNHLSLLDHVCVEKSQEPYLRDANAIEKVKENESPSGNVYLIFLDSTHSEYSFPPNFPLQYQPICQEIDYLQAMRKTPHLELIKNRYRNAICYIDSLLGDLFSTLKQKGLFDSAIIAITGDHGEEFFEEGALFHGSHLNEYQTKVPILLKFPSHQRKIQTNRATHIDLFPSIFHFLTDQSDFSNLFDGHSIFTPSLSFLNKVTIQQNGGASPTEFCLENLDLFLHARIKTANHLEIIELKGFFESDNLPSLLQNMGKNGLQNSID